jgi:methylenetetrahydrofolate dehydrogenase (NADP+)/methenyltetrahydrofolate cyclohydrolase
MDGKALAERVRAEVAEDVRRLDRAVGLATVLVGEDPASEIYVSSKQKVLPVGCQNYVHACRSGDPRG